jgi:hypothetical protein
MSININTHFFKFTTTAGSGFNNLCTIIHQLAAAGQYTGQVYLQGNPLGAFTLTVDPSVSTTQVQIDASAFDQVSQINLKNQVVTNPAYSLAPGGYVLFYASGAQNGFYVTLSTTAGTTTTIVFDTRDLDNGDYTMFRPVNPGNYTVTNDKGAQTAAITVSAYPGTGPASPDPVTATLTQTGFTPNNIQLVQLQALMISVGIPASLSFSNPAGS